jgi:alanine racemase
MDGTQAIIHLDNLRANLKTLSNLAGGRPMCLAVKADAYGHGAVEISRAALAAGVSHLGVARISEAAELRDAGIESPILLFSAAEPGELKGIIEYGIQAFVPDLATLRALADLASPSRPARVHIKTDTGMGRIGCPPEELPALARFAAEQESLVLEGVATHYPLSDDPGDPTADRQIAAMAAARSALESDGIRPRYWHAANSGGIIFHARDGMDMVRPGISAYGYAPDQRFAGELAKRGLTLKPVMELVAPVSFVKAVKRGSGISYGHIWKAPRDGWIATVNAGYADGYPRLSSGRNMVRINGREYPQVGRICMDQCMADLGPRRPEIVPGDRAVLFGPDGPETAASIAEAAQTISYEVTCGITRRVRRIYR